MGLARPGRVDIGRVAKRAGWSCLCCAGLLGLDQSGDLDQVVGYDPMPAPDPGSLDAVHQGAIPAIQRLRWLIRPSQPVRDFTSRRKPRECSSWRREAEGRHAQPATPAVLVVHRLLGNPSTAAIWVHVTPVLRARRTSTASIRSISTRICAAARKPTKGSSSATATATSAEFLKFRGVNYAPGV
jgi:hypothetical protein